MIPSPAPSLRTPGDTGELASINPTSDGRGDPSRGLGRAKQLKVCWTGAKRNAWEDHVLEFFGMCLRFFRHVLGLKVYKNYKNSCDLSSLRMGRTKKTKGVFSNIFWEEPRPLHSFWGFPVVMFVIWPGCVTGRSMKACSHVWLQVWGGAGCFHGRRQDALINF